ncbi:hypothetical protein [Geodermatophilus marinus]|uniref:hypothetical protein n=1 Tax=Geodermatophilus sp. LHW52908 TaxID=2303986 RepID=UPI000E3B8332|nr:hypothetical protein [Geodermatophilus sp. LHW52908]RFU21014.1 hypothetical protein D0Z06_13070 [Geodermatophilus sp. LHW52908]
MTSTITGLPDRYRPLDELGPPETTATGVIHAWRARDRVLNRDVAIRVHTPGGHAAREWITRALTAGGLATPTLAMVYDAAEGHDGPGGAAYVVNEWIEGRTLADRLADGPMPEAEARTVLRRLAEGVAEAHRVGLAVGGLTPEAVVLRPNGLVGLRAVPAVTGTMQGDIAALGELVEHCLTAGAPGRAAGLSPDLAALVRRARSTEPGSLSSVAAMAALLAERPRRPVADTARGADESDSGWLRRLRERRDAAGGRADDHDEAGDAGVHLLPPEDDDPAPTLAARGSRRPAPPAPPAPPRRDAEEDLLPLGDGFGAEADERWADDRWDDDRWDDEEGTGSLPENRRRALVIGLPLLALAVVVALAWWVGSNVLSVAGSVEEADGAATSPPASSAPAAEPEPAAPPAAGPAAIAGSVVFNPFGDGEPENDDAVGLSHDGDPGTAWSTVTYRGSAAFGNLKPGVGVRYDLGDAQPVSGVSVTTTTPGIAVEVRAGTADTTDLEAYPTVAAGAVDGTTELAFPEPVDARYVLVWITSLVPAEGGFEGDLAEVTVTRAG